MIWFHPKAKEEALAALDYYENQQIGLGTRFLLDFEETTSRLQSHPKAWPAVIPKNKNYRRCFFKRFPFWIDLYNGERFDRGHGRDAFGPKTRLLEKRS